MAEENKYDLIVVGGGPAGYAAAIRAGQLGRKVACVEMERAGGTCLNWGCIPSKALLKSAEAYQAALHSEVFGFTCGEIEVDFERVMLRSRSVADQMGKGIEFLFKKNKVDYVVGRGFVHAPGMVEILDGDKQGEYLTADKVMLATGCKPRRIPDLPVDGERIMTSREALAMKKMPKSIVIVGAGAIGAEFAYFLNAFGCKVTLVEMMPQVLPVEDGEVAAAVARSFEEQGIDCRTQVKVENVEVGADSVSLDLVSGEEREGLEVESVVWRGPMVMKTIQQFASNVQWGKLDLMLVDLPPGTGDAQLSLAQTMPLDGALIVTTPQKAAVDVARRGARMFEKVNVPLLGVVENMSYLLDEESGHKRHLFGKGGGAAAAETLGAPFLGEVPLEERIRLGGDNGIPLTVSNPESAAAAAYSDLAEKLWAGLAEA